MKEQTQVFCDNLEKDVVDWLKSESLNVCEGSLGKIIDVKPERYGLASSLPISKNWDFPTNLHEYDVIIEDMHHTKHEDYKLHCDRNEIIEQGRECYLSIFSPYNEFDPIPFTTSAIGNKLRDKIDAPIIIVLFQEQYYTNEYKVLSHVESGIVNQIKVSNYEFIHNYCKKDISGDQVELADNQLSKAIFDGLLDEISYCQTYKSPLIHNSNDELVIPDWFIPLLTNKQGDIVSYIELDKNQYVFMLPRVKNKKAVLQALFTNCLYCNLSQYFPLQTKNSWLEKPSYALSKVVEKRKLKEELTAKYHHDLEIIESDIKQIKDHHRFLYGLLTDTGAELVNDMVEYLHWLGYSQAIAYDDENPDGLLEEDVQIDQGDKGLIIMEVKGIHHTSKDNECSQISKIRRRREKKRKKMDVMAHYVVNHQRGIEPTSRQIPPFTDTQIQDAINDERGLMYTYQLFNLFFDIENKYITKDEACECFKQTGLVDFYSMFIKLGKPYQYYQDSKVICLDIKDTKVEVGDLFYYEDQYGRLHRTEVIDIQENKKSLSEVSSGRIGFCLSEAVPRNKEIMIKYNEKLT